MEPNHLLRNRPCIYGIQNRVNGKIYVGKTKCIYKRCHQYIYDFKNRSIGHLNNHLYNAMVKYGIDNFTMFPLDFCDLYGLAERELFWIEQFRATQRQHGYNLRCDSSTGMIVHEETRQKISANLKRQWSDGIRDQHSEKMRESWSNNPERRSAQGKIFSRLKTKWEYVIDGTALNYAELKVMGLQNVIAQFYRSKHDIVTFKGLVISRRPYGGSNVEDQT